MRTVDRATGTGDLRTACERTLFQAARAEGAGSRQAVRAAARRFVKRHRRNASYLRWVLKSVAASSALALVLLGLGAPAASADTTLFAQRTGADNPLDSMNADYLSRPTLGDLDGDGDLDLLVGEDSGRFRYYENTGTATSPVFVERTGALNPLNGMGVPGYSAPTLGDLDGDGDLDLVTGKYDVATGDGGFEYFENVGTATSPAFTQRLGAANPLDGADVGPYSAPTLGDLDGDGDLDLVSGDGYGDLRYYENTGDATNPIFVERIGAANPLDGEFGGTRSRPTLADADGDGDLDLISSSASESRLWYFENTGDPLSPAFARIFSREATPFGEAVPSESAPTLGDLDGDGDLDLVTGTKYAGNFGYYENLSGDLIEQTGVTHPLGGEDVGNYSKPAMADLDGDGDLDVFVGEVGGTFFYYQKAVIAFDPVFIERTGTLNPLDGVDVGSDSTLTFGDLDGDGDFDAIAGNRDGVLRYFENTGDPTNPAFVEQTGVANPLDGEDLGLSSSPSLGDVDGDGDLDLVAGSDGGTFAFFENTGDATNPIFVERTGAAHPLDGEDVGNYSTPTLGDADGDGDLDLVSGEVAGSFKYYENTGGAANPTFVERTASDNPLDGEDLLLGSSPALGDLDGDGDLDVLAGKFDGTIHFFENTILRPTPSTFELIGPANPLDGESGGISATTTVGDLDGDGDRDLITGNFDGSLRYYENIGTALRADFVQRTGAANPLDGFDVGADSAPNLGDLDGDGKLDLVVGKSNGQFTYFKNTGTATAPVFTQQFGVVDDPLSGQDIGDDSTPALGDFDGDGDLDLLVGEDSGVFNYFENTGTTTSPAFTQVFGAANPLDGEDVGSRSAPAMDDVDGDGDLDVIAGADDGTLRYYENTGSPTSPVFVERTGADNPVDGWDVGDNAKPALGNLDGDGDSDLVVASNLGTFQTYAVPEPGAGLLLGAGLAWLQGLARLRRNRGRASADEG